MSFNIKDNSDDEDLFSIPKRRKMDVHRDGQAAPASADDDAPEFLGRDLIPSIFRDRTFESRNPDVPASDVDVSATASRAMAQVALASPPRQPETASTIVPGPITAKVSAAVHHAFNSEFADFSEALLDLQLAVIDAHRTALFSRPNSEYSRLLDGWIHPVADLVRYQLMSPAAQHSFLPQLWGHQAWMVHDMDDSKWRKLRDMFCVEPHDAFGDDRVKEGMRKVYGFWVKFADKMLEADEN